MLRLQSLCQLWDHKTANRGPSSPNKCPHTNICTHTLTYLPWCECTHTSTCNEGIEDLITWKAETFSGCTGSSRQSKSPSQSKQCGASSWWCMDRRRSSPQPLLQEWGSSREGSAMVFTTGGMSAGEGREGGQAEMSPKYTQLRKTFLLWINIMNVCRVHCVLPCTVSWVGMYFWLVDLLVLFLKKELVIWQKSRCKQLTKCWPAKSFVGEYCTVNMHVRINGILIQFFYYLKSSQTDNKILLLKNS